jgi:GntR family transcriptional repressor for pyruvate dehydrogenase complex
LISYCSGEEYKLLTAATRSTLHEDVLHQLYSAIENGQWAPGEKLPGEQLLAERFEVSRNCIREVMKVLANRGIVWTKPGSGTFLAENASILTYFAKKELNSLGGIELKELIETRCLVEGQVAYYAAKRGSDKEFDELEGLLFETDDLDLYHEMHMKFHDKLAEIARNKMLTQILGSIHNEIAIQRERYREYHTETLKNVMYNHAKLLRCLKSREPKEARQAMVEHIIAAWSAIFNSPLDI